MVDEFIQKFVSLIMENPIVILTVLLVIIGVVTIIIMLKQSKERRKEVKLAELKASLPPDININRYYSGNDGHGGINISYMIVGRAEVPIKLQRVTLQTWDRNNPRIRYRPIEENLSGELANNDRLPRTLPCPRDKFETEETDAGKLEEAYFFCSVAGELCIHYLDFKENLQKRCITIDQLG